MKINSTFFSNLNIGQRLTLGFGILIVLMLLVGAVSYAATNAQAQSLEQVVDSNETADLVGNISLELTQAQQFADDFLLRWRTEGFQQAYNNYIIPNQEQTQTIREVIAETRLVEDEAEILEGLDTIEQATLDYDVLFILLANRIEQRGHVDTGLEGQFRESAHALEASPVIVSSPDLLVSLLQMRRNEKDYLLRGLQEDVNDTVRFTIQLQLQIRGLAIPPEQQQELINLSNDYLVGFMQLAGLDRQIAIDTNTLRATVQSITPLLQSIIANEEAEAEENLANLRITEQLAQTLSTGLLILATFAGIVLAFVIRRSITRPLAEMTGVAAALSAGDLNRRANVVTHDEIGALAQTFNVMAQQIQEVVSSLENRVAARTTDLAITVEVGSLAMSIRNQEELLPKIVEFIRARFGLYYTQIYLLDEAKRFAHLRAGSGKVGEQLLARNHRLDMDDISLVATAVRTGEPVLVNDTEASALHKKNPLLPDTRSEISIPLVIGDDILGILDMQAVNAGTFNQDNIGVFQAMANQLAAALRSAQAYGEARQAIDRTEAVNRRLTSSTWQPYMERLSGGRPVGYEYDLETPRALEAGIHSLNGANTSALTHAIALRGQSIGKVVIQDEEEREWTAEELALVASVTERVALALEQFRAFDETQQSEESTRNVQRFLDSVVENIPNMIFVKDAENLRFVTLNRAGEELLGVKREDLMHKNDYDLFAPEEADFFTAKDRQVLDSQAYLDIPEESIQTQHLGNRILHTKKIPILDSEGKSQYLLGVSEDITERKLLEEERQLLYNAANKLNSARTASELMEAIMEYPQGHGITTANLLYLDNDEQGQPEWAEIVAAWEAQGVQGLPEGTRFYLPEFPFSRLWVANPHGPTLVENVESNTTVDEATRALLTQSGIRAMVLLPLYSQTRWIGLATFSWNAPTTFTQQDQRLYTSLTRQATARVDALRSAEETRQAREDANTLYEIGVLINEAQDEQQIVDAFVQHLVVPEIASVSMNLWENGDFDTATTFIIPAGWWRDPELEFRGVTMQMTSFPFTSLIDRHDITVFDNVYEDSRIDEQSRQALAMFKTGAFVLAPFTIGERFLGTLAVSSSEPRAHSEREIRMLRSLSDPIATAIERLRLNRQTEKRAAEMETVAMVSSAVTTLMEVDSLLEAVANLTKDSFNLYHAHIYLLDEDNLVVAGGAGEPGRIMKDQRRTIPLNHPHSIVANVGRTQLGVIANDVTQNPDFLPHPLLPETKSEMAIPLLIGDELIGVLDVQASTVNRFTDDDMRVMSTLASQIAVAVQNARAFDETKAAQQLAAQEKNTLRTLIDSIPDAIYIKDAQARFITCNARQASLIIKASGSVSSLEEIVGKTDLDLFPDNGAQYYADELAILASGNPMLTKEEPIMELDGSPGWHLTSKLPVRDSRGNIVGLVGIGINITERKRQEEAMRENQAQLAEAQRIARLGRWSWNLANNDIIWNDQMFEINGVSPDTAMNFEVFSSTLHPEDAPGLMSGIEGLLQSGDQNTWPEYRIIRPTGEIRYLTATGTVKRDAQGKPYEMVGIVQDITEAKRIQQERQILFEASSKLNDARSPQDVMEAVNNYARDMGCISATLMYVDSDKNNQAEWASVVANWAVEGSIPTDVGTRFYLPEFPFSRLWTSQTDKPTLIDDIVTNPLVDEATRGLMMQFGIRGLGLLPLYTQGRWVALMSFSWGEAATFAERDIRIFTSMAQQATSAVDALRLAEATRQARDEAEILYNISNQLTTARTLDELLAATVRYAQNKNVYSASLLYIDTDRNGEPEWAETVASWEAEGAVAVPVGTRFYLPEFPFSKLWTSNPHDVTLEGDALNSETMDDTTREIFRQFGIAGIVLLPLYTKDNWIGLMTFSWNAATAFTDQDHRVFSSIMRQTTSVVDAMRSSALTRKRALELATVAQVSAAATTILDVEPLLQQVSDLTKLSFNLYHAHIYLLENNTLVLTAGAGEVGRAMREQGRSISFNQANSLVARAARERKGIIVNDVTQNPDFLPNPLLPDTKSEMAIPMLVGEQLIGVLDVQGDIVNRFSDEDVQIMSTLAAQVAVAVRNARAFELERQTAERLREVDRLKSQFLANMSHELRTPLNSIIGYSEVLLDGGDGDLTEEAVEDVETIHGSGQHLLAIINDILDLAKIEAGQMQINRQDADLTKFLTEIVHAGQILVKDKPVTLTLVEEAELPHVHADPIRLRQIVWNLVSNAVKFTEKGEVTVSVGLLDDKQAYVKVTDSGIGIKAEDVGVVFDQFRQVDGSSTRRAGGTGLGLTITRHLIRLHGGDIFVESEFGVGSTFWFSLPLYTRVNN